MLRNYQVMSSGSGAVAIGTVTALDARTAQTVSRDYPIQIALTGTTAQRPKAGDPDFLTGLQGGIHYLDSTLGYIVVSDGAGGWRNPASGASV